MSFLVTRETRVVIQGLTGSLGSVVVDLMARGGHVPVAGVVPGKGGQSVSGVPVFDTMSQAVEATGASASLVLVPAPGLRDAALEAIDAELDVVALMVDGVPISTTVAILDAGHASETTVIGPNSPGLISPGECLLGAINPERFMPGRVAVVSRSGGMMSTIAACLSQAGIGTSTCIGIGGDALIGLDMKTAVSHAEADPDTDAIVIYGEIGTSQEEALAAAVARGEVTKPVVAYVAGTAAPTGIRYSHAGAMSEGEAGGAKAKKHALRSAGATVVDRYVDLPAALNDIAISVG